MMQDKHVTTAWKQSDEENIFTNEWWRSLGYCNEEPIDSYRSTGAVRIGLLSTGAYRGLGV